MSITGRGKFVGELVWTGITFHVRVDDERNDAFWLELSFTEEELQAAKARANVEKA